MMNYETWQRAFIDETADLKIGEFVVDNTGKTWVVDAIETDENGDFLYWGSDEHGKETQLHLECLIA